MLGTGVDTAGAGADTTDATTVALPILAEYHDDETLVPVSFIALIENS